MDQQMDTAEGLRMHHAQTLWMYWILVILGCWLVLMPATFSYDKGLTAINEARRLWLDLPARVTACEWSDRISGLILIFFGLRSIKPDRPVSLWICCLAGVWLNAAPLLFWAPSALIYANDTLIGVLVIAFSVLTPGMPNMMAFMKMGSEVPDGWSYNPSSWDQRWIMIVLGFAGWMVSRYLGAWQLGFIDKAWDPFFGGETQRVLNSAMSRSWPISDGALGAFAYTFEFLMGWMGGPARWRTMPWMVTFFGILVIPLGLVHIFLVMSQPIAVGSWCSLCLLAAAIMLPMLPLEVDEVIAMGQHMVQATRNGEPFWRVFWLGGQPVEKNEDKRSPKVLSFADQPRKIVRASVWGMSIPPTLAVATVAGIALLFAPGIWHIPIGTMAAHVFYITGALIVVCSVISMGEVVRVIRWVNLPAGLTVAVVPWFFDAGRNLGVTGSLIGLLVCLLSVPRGRITETYGLWQKYIH
ncbi:MAG: vitamin K epoxide reductase family protein [Bacteroidetes bacterium]|nr:vitamin K epoxide reductase family protein [Bacteroidota bacterium]